MHREDAARERTEAGIGRGTAHERARSTLTLCPRPFRPSSALRLARIHHGRRRCPREPRPRGHQCSPPQLSRVSVLRSPLTQRSAEHAVDERLAPTSNLYLLAIAQFATSVHRASESPPLSPNARSRAGLKMRSWLLVVPLYEQLGSQALRASSSTPSCTSRLPSSPRKTVDSVTDLSNNAMKCGHPWPALQPRVFVMAISPVYLHREHVNMTAARARRVFRSPGTL